MSTINFSIQDYQNTSAIQNLNYNLIGGVTWSITPFTVIDAYDPKITVVLGNLNDLWQFKVPNIKNNNSKTYNIQDKIQFNLCLNGASIAGSNLIMTGLMSYVEERVGPQGTYLIVHGISFDELVSNGLVGAADLGNVTVFQYLEYCLNQIKIYAPTLVITWDSGNPTTQAYNPATGLYDGAALPLLLGGQNLAYFGKTLDQILNALLNNQYTGDGRYYWYVSPQQTLVIRKMLYNAVGSITEGTDPIISAQLTVDTNAIYNAIVVQAGNDSAGNPISTFYQDPASEAQYGIQPYLLTTVDANTLLQQDMANTPGWANNSTYPPSYPHTCVWKDSSGGTVTASNDSDYISKFRVQVKILGTNSAVAFVATHSRGLKVLTLELTPSVTWHLGDIINVTLPSYNLTNFPIRVYQIDYTYDNTVLTLKEEFLYSI